MMNVDLHLGDTQLIIDECRRYGCLRNQTAYILATAYWETGRTMKPVVEAFWLSENWRKNNLRYYPWHGRGYVQLTWERNYKKAARELGIPFDKNPELALESKPAAAVLVKGSMEGWFTSKKIPDYITLNKSDWINARKVINGIDKRYEIASIAKDYDETLKEVWEDSQPERPLESTEKPVEQRNKDLPSDITTEEGLSLLSAILRIIRSIFKGRS
jgi:putative chitinase